MEATNIATLEAWGLATAPGTGVNMSWSASSFSYPTLSPILCGFTSGSWALSGLVTFQSLNAGLVNTLSGTLHARCNAPPPPLPRPPSYFPTTFSPTTSPATFEPTAYPTTLIPTFSPTATTSTPTTTPTTNAPTVTTLAPTDTPTTSSPTGTPTTEAPITAAPSLTPTVAPPCPPLPPTGAEMSSELTFSPATAEEVTADVEAEAVLLISQSAGVDTSQVTFTLSEGARHRRARQLRQSSVAVALEVIFYLNDLEVDRVRNKSAADPDAFITTVMNNPDSLFAAATEAFLKKCAAECVSVEVSANATEGWLCLGCPTGFEGNGTHCKDEDECHTDNGGCDARTTCSNLYGSRSCGLCPQGFTGNGAPEMGGCVDTDECSVSNGGCDFRSICFNEPGGFYCGDCPSGFSGTGDTECVDINECLDETACDELTICTNLPGDYSCTACPAGYSGTGKTGCSFFTSCEGDPCDPLTQCSVENDRVTCSDCPLGYSGSGFVGCTEIDGCAATAEAPNGPCFPGVACTDVPAPGLGFACAGCPEGYVGEYGVGELGCKLDLCPLGNACSTDPQVTCTMVTATDLSCGSCPRGYAGDGYVSGGSPGCVDVDECALNNPCDPLVTCTNLPGGVECGVCPEGFAGTGLAGCQEITGSCAERNGGCWTNGKVSAECSDVDAEGMQLASPVCGRCPAGYEDSPGSALGTACVDIDGCAVPAGAPGHCAEGSTCLDVAAPGTGLTCSECFITFTGDGYNPERYPGSEGCYPDACFTSNGGCSTNPAVKCTNVRDAMNGRVCGPGCPVGYTDVYGDATVCEDEKSCELYPCFSSVLLDPPVSVACRDLPAPATGPDGRVCGPCPEGFTGDGATCTDIDECLVDNGGCFVDAALVPPVKTSCTNAFMDRLNPKGRKCGPCPDGYKGSGDTECIWVEVCGAGDSTSSNGGCWVGQGEYSGLATTCTDLPDQGGTECGPCPAGMRSPDGTGATGCVEVDACLETPCFAGVSCVDYKAFEEPPTGRRCTYEAFDPTVDGVAAFDWTCPEGYKGDGVDCVACSMLVRITNATVVDGATNRAGWNLDKTLQVMGQLTGLDSPACTDLQGTYFRWVASVSDGSELVLGEINKASTRTLTVFKSQLKVKRNYIISFQGILRGNPAVTGAAALPFYVKSLPIASSMTGGDVVTGDRAAVIINASGTYDPDGQPGEIAFSWRCRIDGSTSKCMTRSPADPTIGEPLPSSLASPVLNLTMLGGGGGDPINYTFTLTATKGDRSTVVSTRLSIFQGGAPVPSIAALVCSQPPCKANPDTKLTLRASVASDDPAHLWTLWSVEAEPEENAFEISSETCLTSPYNRDLVVRPNVMKEHTVYTFTLTATDRIGPSSAKLMVTVNSPPTSGSLAVEPTEGTELDTNFRLTAVAWVDEDKPLRYRLHYRVPGVPGAKPGEGAFKALGADYSPAFEQVTVLPQAGLVEHSFQVTVRLSVIDNFDAVGQFEVNVTVRPQAVLVTDNVLKSAVIASLSGDTDNVMTLVLGSSQALQEHAAYNADSDGEAANAAMPPPSQDTEDYGSMDFVFISMGRRRRRVLLSAAEANRTMSNSTAEDPIGNQTEKAAQVSLMVNLMGVALDDAFRTADSAAGMSGVLESVLNDPLQLTDESQTSALGMYSSMSSGTAVYSTMADSVCSGLSSLNVANSQSAARRRRHLLQADADPELHAEATAAAAQRASEVVQVLADLGGSMLSGAVADEVPVSTHSPTLAMKVGRTRADLPDSTLYAAPVDTGDGSLNQVQFPASMGAALASAAEAVARRRRDLLLTSSDSDLDSESETDLEDEDVLPEQEVSLRVLTTSGEIHQSNASAPGYATSGAAGILSAGGVQQVVLGAGNAELAVSGLEEAIEIVMQLDEEQLASHKRRLLNSDDPVGRLECRFWSPVLDAYSTAGCVTLPNPAPAGAQLRWQTKNISSIEDISLAWEVGNHTMTRGCTEHFNAVLDPAIWGGRDAGYRKWAAPAGKDGVYVDNAGCQLIDNSSYPGGCRWQWTTSMFVGTDCVTAPALECLCTHLTDFKALENVDVGETGPPELEMVSGDQMLRVSAVDLLKSVVLLSVCFTIVGVGVAAALTSNTRQQAERQSILTALITQTGTGIYGFKNFGGTWTWSIFEEDRIKGIKRLSERLRRMQRNKLAETERKKINQRRDQLVLDIAKGRLNQKQRRAQLLMFTASEQTDIMRASHAAKMIYQMNLSHPFEDLLKARAEGSEQAIRHAELILTAKWVKRWKRRMEETRLMLDISHGRLTRKEQIVALGLLRKPERKRILERIMMTKTLMKIKRLMSSPLEQLLKARACGDAISVRKAESLLAQKVIRRWKSRTGIQDHSSAAHETDLKEMTSRHQLSLLMPLSDQEDGPYGDGKRERLFSLRRLRDTLNSFRVESGEVEVDHKPKRERIMSMKRIREISLSWLRLTDVIKSEGPPEDQSEDRNDNWLMQTEDQSVDRNDNWLMQTEDQSVDRNDNWLMQTEEGDLADAGGSEKSEAAMLPGPECSLPQTMKDDASINADSTVSMPTSPSPIESLEDAGSSVQISGASAVCEGRSPSWGNCPGEREEAETSGESLRNLHRRISSEGPTAKEDGSSAVTASACLAPSPEDRKVAGNAELPKRRIRNAPWQLGPVPGPVMEGRGRNLGSRGEGPSKQPDARPGSRGTIARVDRGQSRDRKAPETSLASENITRHCQQPVVYAQDPLLNECPLQASISLTALPQGQVQLPVDRPPSKEAHPVCFEGIVPELEDIQMDNFSGEEVVDSMKVELLMNMLGSARGKDTLDKKMILPYDATPALIEWSEDEDDCAEEQHVLFKDGVRQCTPSGRDSALSMAHGGELEAQGGEDCLRQAASSPIPADAHQAALNMLGINTISMKQLSSPAAAKAKRVFKLGRSTDHLPRLGHNPHLGAVCTPPYITPRDAQVQEPPPPTPDDVQEDARRLDEEAHEWMRLAPPCILRQGLEASRQEEVEEAENEENEENEDCDTFAEDEMWRYEELSSPQGGRIRSRSNSSGIGRLSTTKDCTTSAGGKASPTARSPSSELQFSADVISDQQAPAYEEAGTVLPHFERYRERKGHARRDDRHMILAATYAEKLDPVSRFLLNRFIKDREEVKRARLQGRLQGAKNFMRRATIALLGKSHAKDAAAEDHITDAVGTVFSDPGVTRKRLRMLAVKLICFSKFVHMWRDFQDLHSSKSLCQLIGENMTNMSVALPVDALREMAFLHKCGGNRLKMQLKKSLLMLKEQHVMTHEEKVDRVKELFGAGMGGGGAGKQWSAGKGGAEDSLELPLERMLGTALVLAYIGVSRVVSPIQVETQITRAAQVKWELPTERPFVWYVDLFKVMLVSNRKMHGWYNRSVLWNLVLLQKSDGSYELTPALATALGAGDISPESLRLEASPDVDIFKLKESMPSLLMQALQGVKLRDTRLKVWATVCALECYKELPFGWVLNPGDIPSKQLTLGQLTEGYLLKQCEEFPQLAELLPGIRERAKQHVAFWKDHKLEAIKALRQESIDNQAASEAELSIMEQRMLRVKQNWDLLLGAMNKHPWACIYSVPSSAAFTRSQRILVEANKLLVMLFISMLLMYNRGNNCCASYKEWLGCEGATAATECHGKTTCSELYQVRDDRSFDAEVYERASETGQHPENFECRDFPDPNIITHKFYSILISVTIMTTISMLLVVMFSIGGNKPVPTHWTKKTKKKEKANEKRSGIYWLLSNGIFLLSLLSTRGDYVGRLLVRYFVHFSQFAERLGYTVARALHLLYERMKKIRTSIWFINEVLIKRRDPAAVLEALEVAEEKERERKRVSSHAATTFEVARTEMDSFSVQLAYVIIALVWALTIWFLLTFSKLIRDSMGDGVDTLMILNWLESVATDVILIHAMRALVIHVLLHKLREKKLIMQSKDTIVLEWYEDYIGKYLNTAYCLELENTIGEEMMTMDPAI
ncbi:hypothetical protein CYMTET_19055 [Cymbomonas tetramitiformis]|uniref:EGF-like domain-containing protein n=1 Tax=Cymbomonas tetramitiformis TaxID=36881 RepID=A0AAE0G6Y4_9CHLO|nr:hypothetical protein CYMTET_19055 [Cymbomonas tetramitiformis]